MQLEYGRYKTYLEVIFGNVKKHKEIYIKLYRKNFNKKHMKIIWNKN